MTDPKITPRESYQFAVVPARKLPRFRHQEVAEAGVEAERLSREHPGATFIVMKEIARVSLPRVPAGSPSTAGGAGRRYAPKPPSSKVHAGNCHCAACLAAFAASRSNGGV